MQTACHVQGLPLRAQPHLPSLTPTQREPIPPTLFRKVQQVLQLDRNIPNNRVLEEIAVVDHFHFDDRRGLVGA